MTRAFALDVNAVRDVLREQTSELHERLHAHSSFVALFKGELSHSGYKRLLQKLYGFYVPLDGAIEQLTWPLPDSAGEYRYVSRSQLLERDLRDLGASDEDLRETPVCRAAAKLVSLETLGGVIYVVEGAILGGAHIDRAAQKLLGDDSQNGRHYWAWCRANGGRRWLEALRFLGRIHADGAEIDRLSAGALATFRTFAEWIEPLNDTGPDIPKVQT